MRSHEKRYNQQIRHALFLILLLPPYFSLFTYHGPQLVGFFIIL
jgi:hypothetical protein